MKKEDIQSICVFCGAQNSVPERYLAIADQFGSAVAQADKTLVYGGGDCGLMGMAANGALQENGKVIGVFPTHMRALEKEHTQLTEIHLVNTMHERKQMMYDKSDAFVILPGGFGTMDEMFEILTWRQICLHDKPIIIFNYEGYWDHLVQLMRHIISVGFARPETRDMYEVTSDFASLKQRLGI